MIHCLWQGKIIIMINPFLKKRWRNFIKEELQKESRTYSCIYIQCHFSLKKERKKVFG